MKQGRVVRCRDCGRELQTIRHANPVLGAPVVCRKCFGEQTYAGRTGGAWGAGAMNTADAAVSALADQS